MPDESIWTDQTKPISAKASSYQLKTIVFLNVEMSCCLAQSKASCLPSPAFTPYKTEMEISLLIKIKEFIFFNSCQHKGRFSLLSKQKERFSLPTEEWLENLSRQNNGGMAALPAKLLPPPSFYPLNLSLVSQFLCFRVLFYSEYKCWWRVRKTSCLPPLLVYQE